jgi:hypothetical protein
MRSCRREAGCRAGLEDRVAPAGRGSENQKRAASAPRPRRPPQLDPRALTAIAASRCSPLGTSRHSQISREKWPT